MAKSPAKDSKLVGNSSDKPKRKNLKCGAKDGVPFSKTNQPSPESKREGIRRKMTLREILGVVPDKRLKGKLSNIQKEAASKLNIDLGFLDVETTLHYAMLKKAAEQGDVQAYKALIERVQGRPRLEDGPPPPVTPDEEVSRRKSQIDFGDGITFEV